MVEGGQRLSRERISRRPLFEPYRGAEIFPGVEARTDATSLFISGARPRRFRHTHVPGNRRMQQRFIGAVVDSD